MLRNVMTRLLQPILGQIENVIDVRESSKQFEHIYFFIRQVCRVAVLIIGIFGSRSVRTNMGAMIFSVLELVINACGLIGILVGGWHRPDYRQVRSDTISLFVNWLQERPNS